MNIPGHNHITEREGDGSFEDCTWCAGLEFYRDAIDDAPPASHKEAEALRADSGEPPTGGSNLTDFRKGVKVRYDRKLPPAIPAKDVLDHLAPNWCAVIQGSMSAFGPNHPLSKFDRNFDGGHAVYIANVDDRILWCDPEAPNDADVPVRVSRAEVQRFVDAFPGGQAIVAPILKLAFPKPPDPEKETDMPDLTTYTPGATAIIKVNSNVRAAPQIKATKLRTTTVREDIVLTGTVKGDVDPKNGSDVWFTWWKNDRWEFTAKDNVADIKAPGGNVDCTAAVAAAKAPLQATIDQQAAAIAGLKTELAAAPTKERSRIADAEAARIKAL